MLRNQVLLLADFTALEHLQDLQKNRTMMAEALVTLLILLTKKAAARTTAMMRP